MTTKELLTRYVRDFNADDTEHYVQDIPNANAEDWLLENAPLIDIPDKELERIYYFRLWTFRKHIKSTPDGYVITEFLPTVPWGGRHNTIIAAAGHHLSEAKWLKNCKKIVEDYVDLWLMEKSNTYLYSSWIIDALYEYCSHIGDYSYGISRLDLLVHYYESLESKQMTRCGLFWSIDGHDAMEYSISGVNEDLVTMKGVRPTLNSYMAANALAISRFARIAGDNALADEYQEKHDKLVTKMNRLLWDGGFYKAIHTDELDAPSFADLPSSQNVKELIGYIPWQFNLAPRGLESAFKELKDSEGFLSKHGLTTAEQRHPRYLYSADHPCLWNGYIWPFAISQTLRSIDNLLTNYEQSVITESDFYSILKAYARSHYITENGKTQCWIDEVKSPVTNEWSCRSILKSAGWRAEDGGLERGKDYNHSTFCDIILGSLLGIKSRDGKISVKPRIPDNWAYFTVDNLCIGKSCYRITYDKNGEKYRKGISITAKTIVDKD